MLTLGMPPDPRRREMGDGLFCLQRMYAQQLAVFAAVIPLELRNITLPPVETIQRASALILAEPASLVRAPQLPTDAINMLIDPAACATPQRWIALICFHGSITLHPSAQASTTERRCTQSRSIKPCLANIGHGVLDQSFAGPYAERRAKSPARVEAQREGAAAP
jgi:hypothetical protein